MLLNILIFTFLASILSLILVSALVFHKSFHKISFALVSFAAGALLAMALQAIQTDEGLEGWGGP